MDILILNPISLGGNYMLFTMSINFVLKNFWFKETQYIVLDNFIVMTQIKKPLHIEYQFKTSETPIVKKNRI